MPNVQVQLVVEVQATDMTTLLNFDTSNNNFQYLELAQCIVAKGVKISTDQFSPKKISTKN